MQCGRVVERHAGSHGSDCPEYSNVNGRKWPGSSSLTMLATKGVPVFWHPLDPSVRLRVFSFLAAHPLPPSPPGLWFMVFASTGNRVSRMLGSARHGIELSPCSQPYLGTVGVDSPLD